MQPASRPRILLGVALLLLLSLSLLRNWRPVLAAPFTSSRYTVQSGDTLDAIAQRVGVPSTELTTWVSDVARMNALPSPDLLNVGQQLQLPAVHARYTVQAGDTLGSISLKQGISNAAVPAWIDAVTQLNNLTDPNALSVGQTLEVPVALAVVDATASAAGAGTSTASAGSTASTGSTGSTSSQPAASLASLATTPYTVRSGDTLFAIASRLAVPDVGLKQWVDSIVKLNSLASADSLVVDAVLQIPLTGVANDAAAAGSSGATGSSAATTTVANTTSNAVPYQVHEGDTLFSIAVALNVPDGEFVRWLNQVTALNSDINPDSISIGQQLMLPATFGARPNATRTPPPIDPTTTPTPVPMLVSTATPLVVASATPTPTATVTPVETPSSSTGSVTPTPTATPAASTTPGTTPTPTPTSTPAASGTPTPTSTATGSTSFAGGSCFYMVVATDTWETMAQKRGIPLSLLDAWKAQVVTLNGIANNALPVGDALRVPC